MGAHDPDHEESLIAILPRSVPRAIALVVLGVGWIGAGVNHFVSPDFYMAIMPPWIPWHAELVALSGVTEILAGVGVFIPRTRRLAAWGMMAMLLAFMPVHIHMAMNPADYAELAPPARLYLRIPIQALLAAWVWFAALKRE